MNIVEVDLALGNLVSADQGVTEIFDCLESSHVDDPYGRAHALLLASQVLSKRGQLPEALEQSSRALEIIEELRLKASSPSLTMPFFATRREFFDNQIAVLLELDQRLPTEGYAARAFETLDLSQARSLIESVEQVEAKPSSNEFDAQQLATQIEGLGHENDSYTAGQLEQLLDALRDIQSAAAQPEPPMLDIKEVRAFLDDSTLILAYHLGKDSSHVFTIDAQGVEVAELAPAAVITAQAQRFIELTLSQQTEDYAAISLAADRISTLLLAPIAQRLASAHRLVIVSEGILHRIPVAVLKDPSTGRDLVERYEIARVSSVSLLAALRRRANERSAPHGLAIFADPIFRPGSQRSSAPALTRDDAATSLTFNPSLLPRLRASKREAAAIAKLWSEPPVWIGLGPEASEEAVRSKQLGTFRILHFATHAVLDPTHPELATLVMSTPAPGSQGPDGLLRAYEISGLHLSADLVVLNACRSAIGSEIVGEGVIGLPRAFLHAGASSVLVSLWPVDDEAGAAFMEKFYRNLVQEKKSRAAALRRTQLEFRETVEWSRPIYWAGFELLGDWQLKQ